MTNNYTCIVGSELKCNYVLLVDDLSLTVFVLQKVLLLSFVIHWH